MKVNEDTILLIEDSDISRWRVVQETSRTLDIDYYPKTTDFRSFLHSVDEWLIYLFERRAFVCIDLRLGGAGGLGNDILHGDVIQIIEKIQANPRVQALEINEIFERLRQPKVEWTYKIATVVAAIVHNRGLRCVTTTDGMDTKIEEFLGIKPFPRLMPFTAENLIREIHGADWREYLLSHLWRDTRHLNFHDDCDLQKGLQYFRQMLGNISESDWPFGMSNNAVVESFKSLCGVNSLAEGGDKPLSVLASFYLLVNAISVKMRKPAHILPIEITLVEPDLQAKQAVLPYQSRELARGSIRHLYRLFTQIVCYDEGHERAGQLMIQRICVSSSGIEVILDLDPRARNWQANKPSLAHTIHLAARNCLELPDIELAAAGEVSSMIVAFNQAASIQDRNGFSEGIIYPSGYGLGIHAEQDTTLIRLKTCPTS
jgi:hypothetical protein